MQFLRSLPTKTSFGTDGKKQLSRPTNDLQKLFLSSPLTKTSFGPDGKKQSCHESRGREGSAVIPPRGKLHTDATMVLSSPFESLVLEAVLTVIGVRVRVSGSDPV